MTVLSVPGRFSPLGGRRRLSLAALLGVVCAIAAPVADTGDQKADKAPEALADLRYRSIGPAWGGRVSRAVGVPGDPSTYYLASASGGVWKSVDGGTTFTPVFDDQPIASIGSIAVAPSDPNIVYVGSGEANIRGNVAAGNGIYKSTDAGKTWSQVWKQEGQIGTMAVHPKNAAIAFAAVLGHAFGPNPERGVYRTTDGGRTWQQVLKKDAETGASDVAIDPSNPSVVFAGFWQARRKPWDLVSGGPGSGLHVSRDGGDTWTELQEKGLPEKPWGKVGVAVAPSDGRRVYALIEAEKGGLFRSDDGGESWELASPNRLLRQRAWYYTTLTVHPANPNEVWFPQVPLLRTLDGGRTIERVKGTHHGDHHDVWIDPANPRRMIVASDGGVDVTVDGGENWLAPRLPLGQFYHVTADNSVPFKVAGAMQDIGTAQCPSDSLHSGGITSYDCYDVGGGEAGHVVSDWSDPNIVYAGEYLGIFTRYDHRTRQARVVGAWPDNPSGWAGEQMKYRFQWTAPISVSPHDAKVVYHAAQVLFRSSDGGQSWSVISPDLSRNDKATQRWTGGPITGDGTGVETYGTIFAVAESPLRKDLIWVGTDDGLVHVTRDGGKTWSNVTAAMKGLPEWATISIVEPSRFDEATAYVTVDAHRLDDMRPYLFKTSDYGKTWTRLDGKLAQDVYLHSVREDPARRGLLYAGTERGVVFSSDDGATWLPLQLNLPTVAVHDVAVKDRSLVLGTHGRSLWVLDDLAAVRAFADGAVTGDVQVLPVADVIAWQVASGQRDRAFSGANPPRGAIVHYFFKKKVEGEVALEVLDAKGTVIRRVASTPEEPAGSGDFDAEEAKDRKPVLVREAGLHRGVWDLRHEGGRKIRNAKIDFGDPKDGPLAVPGSYTIRLTAAGQTATQAVKVLPDPRVSTPQGELEAQLAFALAVRADFNRVTDIVNGLQSIRTQLEARLEASPADPASGGLRKASEGLLSRIDVLEGRLHNPEAEVVYDILAMRGGANLYSRLSPLLMFATAGLGPPTQGMKDVHAEMRRELAAHETEYRSLVETDLAAINQQATSLGIPFVAVPKP